MTPAQDADPLDLLRRFAPGTHLRDVVEIILRQQTGALVLFGEGEEVDAVCSGGFVLVGAEFSPARVGELAKMDGGIVVSSDAGEILRANVQFIPNPRIKTSETGTRFRTAERLAKQTDLAVLAVSEEGGAVAAVYAGTRRYELRSPAELQAEANQNLISLERLRRRLESAEDRLTRLEVDDAVTVHDVVLLLERAALVRRMGAQIERIVIELGGAAHLISIQRHDLLEGVDDLAEMVYADYATPRMARTPLFDRLRKVETEDLHDTALVAETLGFEGVDLPLTPRGLRALSRVPRLPDSLKHDLVDHFQSLEKLLAATVTELSEVEGVGRTRGQQVRSYLDRLEAHGIPFAIPD